MASPIRQLISEFPRLHFVQFVESRELAHALEAGELGWWAESFVAIEPVLKTESSPSVERPRASKREHPSQGGSSSSGLPSQGDGQPRAKKRPTAPSRQQRSAQGDQPDASSRLRASNREDGAVEREDDIILCPRAARPRGSVLVAAEELPMGRNIVSGYGHHGNEIIDVSM